MSVSVSSVTDAGNQLVAQEAVRKPSMLRRPPARTGEPISSKNSDHVTASDFIRKIYRSMFKRLTAEAKKWILRTFSLVFQIVSTAVESRRWATGWAHWRPRCELYPFSQRPTHHGFCLVLLCCCFFYILTLVFISACVRFSCSLPRPPYHIATLRVSAELHQRLHCWWGPCPLRELLVSRALQVQHTVMHDWLLGCKKTARTLKLTRGFEISWCSFFFREMRLFGPVPVCLCSYIVSFIGRTLISFSKSSCKSPVVCVAHFQRFVWKANATSMEAFSCLVLDSIPALAAAKCSTLLQKKFFKWMIVIKMTTPHKIGAARNHYLHKDTLFSSDQDVLKLGYLGLCHSSMKTNRSGVCTADIFPSRKDEALHYGIASENCLQAKEATFSFHFGISADHVLCVRYTLILDYWNEMAAGNSRKCLNTKCCRALLFVALTCAFPYYSWQQIFFFWTAGWTKQVVFRISALDFCNEHLYVISWHYND